MDEDKKTEHESFGMIGISRRTSSNGKTLFGSSIKQNSTIGITISEADHTRNLANDWYFAHRQIIEVEMSPSQFTEFITTSNVGSGVPCTIRYREGKRMEEPPYENKQEVFRKEFKEQAKKITNQETHYMKDAIKILEEKSSISKGDRETILKAMKYLQSAVDNSMPFLFDQFQEQMAKTVTEAKGEVEAFVENKIRNAGLTAIKDQFLLNGLGEEENDTQ